MRMMRGSTVVIASLLLLAAAPAAASLRLADALQQALAQNAEIGVVQTRLDAAQGQLQQASGQFDWRLRAGLDVERNVTPLRPSEIVGGANADLQRISSGFAAGLARTGRSGIGVAASVSGVRREDGDALAESESRLEVALNLPLWQGWGGAGLRALEAGARQTLDARRHALRERAALTIYDTLVAYWHYRTRLELDQVAADSQARSTSLLDSISKLVAAAEKPRADLVLLQADQAEKAAARAATALALSDARIALGRVMGIDAAAIASLGVPAETLPGPVAVDGDLLLQTQRLSQLALDKRDDLKAIAYERDAARSLLANASDAARPQLDLNVGVAQNRVGEGGGRFRFLGEQGRTAGRASVFAHLNFAFPIENNRARGAQRERAALLAEIDIRARDLQAGAGGAVDGALRQLAGTGAQLTASRLALSMYEQAVGQEIVKQKNGISTLIDVINTESRFINARIAFLQAQLAHASALARLRLETGTLLPDGENARFTLDVAALTGPGPLAGSLSTLDAGPTP